MASRIFTATVLLTIGVLLIGCGGKSESAAPVDETKPIAEIKAEADKMSVEKLKASAMGYRDAIVAKKAELEKLAAKLKDIPVTEALGEEAKALKTDLESLNKSVAALTERLKVYLDKLKELKADTSGLEID